MQLVEGSRVPARVEGNMQQQVGRGQPKPQGNCKSKLAEILLGISKEIKKRKESQGNMKSSGKLKIKAAGRIFLHLRNVKMLEL